MNPRTAAILLAATTLAATMSGSLLSSQRDHPLTIRLSSEEILASAQAGEFHLTLLGVDYAFHLEPHPIALGAVIGVDGIPIGIVEKTVTFAGTADGLPALVAATGAGVVIAILGPDPIFVEPVWWSTAGAPLDLHRVVLWNQDPPIIPDHPDPAPATVMSNPVYDATEPVVARNRTAKFLLENDFAFHQKFSLEGNCSLCWVEVQQAVMLVAEANFRRDAHIRFNITSQWTCSTATACPYEDTGSLVDINNWVSNFLDRWEGVTTEPDHQLGHLLIATDLDGGGGGACLGCVGTAYALSEFGTPARQESLMEWVIPTHEIGHNFNGTHSRAAPIPPAIGMVPPFGHERVWTVMQPEEPVALQFSDGSYAVAKNNLARILAHAADTLPA